MSKIQKITVQNFKAVSKLSANFNGATAIITGRNNSGKSSFLKGLSDRLRGLKPELILKQGEHDGFYELELTTGEKFVWSFTDKTKAGEKLTYISERNIPGTVTKDICRAYFPPVFDVDDFLTAPPAKQKAVLQKLTGIDFTEFDKVYKAAYEERTYRNKVLSEEKARAGYVDPKLPLVAIPTDQLEKEIAGIDAHNMQFKTFEVRVKEKTSQSLKNAEEIEDLKIKMRKLEIENEELTVQISAGNKWLNNAKNQPKNNEADLQKKLADIKQQNKDIEANNLARLQDEKITKADDFAKQADSEVKKLEAEKLDVIKNASMPDGFGFGDEGITYKGFDFNKQSLSSSGIYIAALKLAALGLGEVKTLHFDASFLDKNSLAEIETWANKNDLQLLIERPDFEGGEITYEIIEK